MASVTSLFPNPKERTPAILVVEDEILIRLVIADYLRECGFKVYEAASAAEAIEIFHSNRAAVDNHHLRRQQEIRGREGAMRERALLRETLRREARRRAYSDPDRRQEANEVMVA